IAFERAGAIGKLKRFAIDKNQVLLVPRDAEIRRLAVQSGNPVLSGDGARRERQGHGDGYRSGAELSDSLHRKCQERIADPATFAACAAEESHQDGGIENRPKNAVLDTAPDRELVRVEDRVRRRLKMEKDLIDFHFAEFLAEPERRTELGAEQKHRRGAQQETQPSHSSKPRLAGCWSHRNSPRDMPRRPTAEEARFLVAQFLLRMARACVLMQSSCKAQLFARALLFQLSLREQGIESKG